MSLEAGSRGLPVAVRISWESIGTREPRAVEVLVDGRPLEVEDPRRVPLPRFDPGKIHFISATLTFDNEQVSRLEASFGGALGEEVRTELTALAVVLDKGAAMPGAAKMAGWFRKDGSDLAVHGVEKGPAEVIFVRDPSAQPHLDRLGELAAGSGGGGPARAPAVRLRSRRDGSPVPAGLRSFAELGKDVSLRFLAPGAAPLPGDDLRPEMFRHSPAYGAGAGGFLRMSQQVPQLSFPTFFTEAVAIAGMSAHGTRRRRAVVALLGELAEDRSQYGAETVRAYLRQLHVPLAVWTLTGSAAHPEWPGGRFVGAEPGARSVPGRFEKAVADLRRLLRRQRIVWLEGRHLPQEIELSAAARGIRLAGR